MGLWSGIKYALNSSLGAPEFKPLDTMIVEVKEQAEEIKATNLINYGSAVKNVQRGTTLLPNAAVSANVTIASVNMAKTTVSFLGFSAPFGSSETIQIFARSLQPRIQLTNSTTLSISTESYTNGTRPTVSWEVVEYY